MHAYTLVESIVMHNVNCKYVSFETGGFNYENLFIILSMFSLWLA